MNLQQNKFKTHYFMIFSITLSIGMYLFLNKIILTNDIYYSFYAEQLSIEQVKNWLDLRNKWSWLIYVFIPIMYFFKIILISTCLYTGFFFYQDGKVRFSEIMGMVVKADLVFLLPAIIKIFWFSFGNTAFSLQDFQYFSPLSLLNIFDVSQVEKWLIYPLQALNIFEVAFWVILGLQLKPLLKNDFLESFKLVPLRF